MLTRNPRGGGHTKHIRLHTSLQKVSGSPKISLQLHYDPKISARFMVRNQCMNTKYPETMQTEVRIASGKPSNISSTIFLVKDIINIISVLFGLKKYHFWLSSNPKL